MDQSPKCKSKNYETQIRHQKHKQQRKGKLELMQIKTYSKGIIKKLKRQPEYLQIIYLRMVLFPGCMKNSYDSIKR